MRAIGKDKIVTARKNYGCDACICISESDMHRDEWFMGELSFKEKRVIAKAHMNGWRVMKGEKCLCGTLVSCDGKDIMTWRAIPEIHDLNIKHDMYQDAEIC